MYNRGCESVGIDLGTTFSSIAYMDDKLVPRIIPDSSGQITTPSVIYFDDEGIVIGKDAQQNSSLDADRVVRFVKIHMGDPWNIEIDGHKYTPESLSGLILRHLVREAESQIGTINSAVITVPAYFTEKRRISTQHAGEIAGLNVLGTLNEPMAATLAFGVHQARDNERVVIFDLGGGTFDVTVVQISPTEIRELATNGNRQLGGRDWDLSLVDYVADEFHKVHGCDPRDDPQTLQDLLIECEKAKLSLSRLSKTPVRAIADGKTYVCEITRDKFEELTSSLLETTRLTTENALEDAGLSWQDVSRVALVGGSTQMPAVRRMLNEVSGSPPDTSVNPITAVALGAATYAYLVERDVFNWQIHRSDTQDAQKTPLRELPEVIFDSSEIAEPSNEDATEFAVPGEPAEIQPTPEPAVAPPQLAAIKIEETDEPAETTDFPTVPQPVASSLPNVHFVNAHGVGVLIRRHGDWSNQVLIPKNSSLPTNAVRRFVTTSKSGGGKNVRVTITQGDAEDPELAEVLGEGRIEGFTDKQPAGQPVDVVMEFDRSGRLHVKAIYVNTGQEMQLTLDVSGALRSEEVQRERQHAESMSFLSVFDPDTALAGLEDDDLVDFDD